MARSRRRETVKTSKLKTLLCTYVDKPEGCQYGANCAFAHSVEELRTEDSTPPERPQDKRESTPNSKGDGRRDEDGESSAHVPFLSINNTRVNHVNKEATEPKGGEARIPGLAVTPAGVSAYPPQSAGFQPAYPAARPPRKGGQKKAPHRHVANQQGSHQVMKMSWNPSNRTAEAEAVMAQRTLGGGMFQSDTFTHALFAPTMPSSYVFVTDPGNTMPMIPMHMTGLPDGRADPWGGQQLVYSMIAPGPLPAQVHTGPTVHTGPPASAPVGGMPSPELPVALDYYPLAYRDWTAATDLSPKPSMLSSAGGIAAPKYVTPDSSPTPADFAAFSASELSTSPELPSAVPEKKLPLRFPCKMMHGTAVEKPKKMRRLVVMNQHKSSCRVTGLAPAEPAEDDILGTHICSSLAAVAREREGGVMGASLTNEVEYVI